MSDTAWAAAKVREMFAALDAGHPIEDVMRAEEQAKGYRVVVPGEVSWLPADDWQPTAVVSLDGTTVRLVALQALVEGRGALSRLLAGIAAAGLSPCILEPTRELQATLKRRGWRGRTVGHGVEAERRWYPRRSKQS